MDPEGCGRCEKCSAVMVPAEVMSRFVEEYLALCSRYGLYIDFDARSSAVIPFPVTYDGEIIDYAKMLCESLGLPLNIQREEAP